LHKTQIQFDLEEFNTEDEEEEEENNFDIDQQCNKTKN